MRLRSLSRAYSGDCFVTAFLAMTVSYYYEYSKLRYETLISSILFQLVISFCYEIMEILKVINGNGHADKPNA